MLIVELSCEDDIGFIETVLGVCQRVGGSVWIRCTGCLANDGAGADVLMEGRFDMEIKGVVDLLVEGINDVSNLGALPRDGEEQHTQ